MSYITWLRKGIAVFFEYDTPRIVHIESKKVGVTSRFVQACILSYIIGYVIVYQRGYQQFDPVESAVTTKLKAYTNFTDDEMAGVPPEWRYLYRRVWDVTDYVVPATQNNAFFVITNIIITPNQNQSTCPEDPKIAGSICDPRQNQCHEGESLPLGHGVNTGRCVQAQPSHGEEPQDKEVFTCEILAWCPLEFDQQPLKDRALLAASANFTVLIKNQIEFPLYEKRRSNILESSNSTYLQSCLYDQETDPFCPVFKLGTIVRLANETYEDIAINGAVMSIIIHWDCNLDHDFMSRCVPIYKFRRLDSADAKIAPGYNFRFAEYYKTGKRTLFKAYGILFVLDVQGRAGKFSFIPFFINLGAGLALLSIATIICDIFVLYVMRDRQIYRDKKYLMVKGSDAFSVYREMDNSEDDDGQQGPAIESENSRAND
ncbi:hypothetical protein TCAL_08494 [Tigriopus californicus]|uniref:Uncharacterized protein n=1 Tax=Tigriopus californicus TaxID=6832 RepID=A0A553PBQ3_TIGCA|nr:hypothetical protein TCAL_08494 [Tigriopus californicus]